MRRRDLHGARAERRIGPRLAVAHEIERHDRNLRPVSGSSTSLAVQMLVALVVGVHRDRGVAEHRLGARRRDDDLAAAADERVLDLPQRAVLLGGVDLEVGHHGLARGIPVDHPLRAEDQALLVEAHERLAHGAVGPLVHREPLALPVEREAHQLLLLADAIAAALLPRPRAAHELLAAELEARLVLAALEVLLEQHVDRDRRVVDAGHPHRVEALHPLPADQDVLHRRAERVADVQRAGDVRRRQRDRVRDGRARLVRVKETVLEPEPEPARLHLATGRTAWEAPTTSSWRDGTLARDRVALRNASRSASLAAASGAREVARDSRE